MSITRLYLELNPETVLRADVEHHPDGELSDVSLSLEVNSRHNKSLVHAYGLNLAHLDEVEDFIKELRAIATESKTR